MWSCATTGLRVLGVYEDGGGSVGAEGAEFQAAGRRPAQEGELVALKAAIAEEELDVSLGERLELAGRQQAQKRAQIGHVVHVAAKIDVGRAHGPGPKRFAAGKIRVHPREGRREGRLV